MLEVAGRRARRLVRARLVERHPARFLVQPHGVGEQPIGEAERRFVTCTGKYAGIRHAALTISSKRTPPCGECASAETNRPRTCLRTCSTFLPASKRLTKPAANDSVTSSSRMGRLPAPRFRAL